MEIETRIKEKMLALLEEIVDNPNPHGKPEEWGVYFGDAPVFRVLSILSKIGPRPSAEIEVEMSEAKTLTTEEKNILIDWLSDGQRLCDSCKTRRSNGVGLGPSTDLPYDSAVSGPNRPPLDCPR